jgi:hypothetical protein
MNTRFNKVALIELIVLSPATFADCVISLARSSRKRKSGPRRANAFGASASGKYVPHASNALIARAAP